MFWCTEFNFPVAMFPLFTVFARTRVIPFTPSCRLQLPDITVYDLIQRTSLPTFLLSCLRFCQSSTSTHSLTLPIMVGSDGRSRILVLLRLPVRSGRGGLSCGSITAGTSVVTSCFPLFVVRVVFFFATFNLLCPRLSSFRSNVACVWSDRCSSLFHNAVRYVNLHGSQRNNDHIANVGRQGVSTLFRPKFVSRDSSSLEVLARSVCSFVRVFLKLRNLAQVVLKEKVFNSLIPEQSTRERFLYGNLDRHHRVSEEKFPRLLEVRIRAPIETRPQADQNRRNAEH